jgi:viroplasmin and RNaseH domain-containing protein
MKYFLHDTSSFDDEKITELFLKFGYEGLGLFYTTLEKIARQEKPVKTDVLKSQLHIGRRLNKCWDFMEEIGLISSSNGDTFNERLLNFSETYEIKKENTRKRVSEWRERQRNTKNVTNYKHVSNATKVKLSKDKEEKKEEILIINPEKEKEINDWNESILKDERY